MKKIIIFIALFIPISLYAAQIDPLWRLQKPLNKQILEHNAGKVVADNKMLIEVFIKTSDIKRTTERIRSCGGKVKSIIGSIITASLPTITLEKEATDWTEVKYIEAARAISAHNDLANADTGVTTVQAGTGLPYGFDGTGVIIGIIDTGIDLNHPAFKSESGLSRILYLWDQGDETGPGPSEIESTYGTEYTQTDIITNDANEQDTDGHGTHVTGIAGGRDSAYSGVAPRASFIVVKYKDHPNVSVNEWLSTNVADAANYIFQKAEDLGMPAVINMSLGSEFGPRDGTSLTEEVFNELVSASPGRSIVATAGNSAMTAGGTHIGYEVTDSIDKGSFFTVYYTEGALDIWGDQDCNMYLNVGLYDEMGYLSDTGWIAPGETANGILSNIVEYQIDRSETSNPLNNKWHSYVDLWVGDGFDSNLNYFDITFSGTCPSFDAWAYPYDGTTFTVDSGVIGDYEYVAGDSNSSVEMPSTAADVISVGAYATRGGWLDGDGQEQVDLTVQVGDLATFSSHGPALDAVNQGTKPNITAPGIYLISALSADCDPEVEFTRCPSTFIIDDDHMARSGTSMASSHVAGIVALMFQAYPFLTYSEIIDYLQSTARTDEYVGDVPNANWGHGKVNAHEAVKAVVTDHPSEDDNNITVDTSIGGLIRYISSSTQTIGVSFSRPVKESTLTSANLYITETSETSSLSTSWNPSLCDHGNAISTTVTLDDPQTVTIDLGNGLESGYFAICLSPNITDTDGTTFWGKTFQFKIYDPASPSGSCSLASFAQGKGHYSFLILFMSIAVLTVTRFRNNTT